MKTLSLSLPDVLIDKTRAYAREQGKSLNKFVGELLSQRVSAVDSSWFDEMKFQIKEKDYNSGGWKFDREDLYTRG